MSFFKIHARPGKLTSILLSATLFILSLAGLIVQNLDVFVLRGAMEVWGSEVIYLPAIVVVIGVALVWYSRQAKERGWVS